MKKFSLRVLALAVMATALIGFSGVASAGMGNGSPCGYNQNLTPEQQTKMQKMHTEFLTATESTRQQLIMKRAELKAQMSSTNPDTAKIESISKDLGVLEGKMRAECVKFNKLKEAEGLPCVGMGSCMEHGMGMGMGDGMMKHNGGKGGNAGGHGGGHGGGGNGNCSK